MEKKLYYKFSDGNDYQGMIMELSGCMKWIEADQETYKELDEDEMPVYTLEPIWLTDEEFENLPEHD